MKSASSVVKAAIIAMKPAKGKVDQGISGRQGLDNADMASGSMWTNPVARMTPAAKALMAKKKLESVLRSRQFLPTSGTADPRVPARKMEAMATILRIRAVFSSRHASNSGDPLQLLVDIDIERLLERNPFFDPKGRKYQFWYLEQEAIMK